jgi:hypothetical protein
MVAGLNKFTEYFHDFTGSYIIIGGTACDIIIENAGFEPRATDDIDIVLIVEALKPAFIIKFWKFIKDGEYLTKQIEPEKRNRYRFSDPQSPDFPIQIELFSKLPDTFETGEDAWLTPIPSDDGLSSLSAILLDSDYYEFTISHSVLKEGVHFADIDALICLKAFAYLDNKRLKAEGKKIRTRDVVKHKHDVFRMVFLINPGTNIILPEALKRDLLLFAGDVAKDLPDPAIFKDNGFGEQDMAVIFDHLLKFFNLTV